MCFTLSLVINLEPRARKYCVCKRCAVQCTVYRVRFLFECVSGETSRRWKERPSALPRGRTCPPEILILHVSKFRRSKKKKNVRRKASVSIFLHLTPGPANSSSYSNACDVSATSATSSFRKASPKDCSRMSPCGGTPVTLMGSGSPKSRRSQITDLHRFKRRRLATPTLGSATRCPSEHTRSVAKSVAFREAISRTRGRPEI